MRTIIVQGFSPTNKVPGAKGAVLFASGRASSALFQRVVLVVGLLGSGAIATANVINDVRTPADVAKFGNRSELARMCRAALKEPGVVLKAVAVTAPGGAAAATATITVAGTWSVPWTFYYRVAGELVTGVIAAGDSVTQAAVKIRDALLSNPFLPTTASSSAGVVTLTADAGSVRNNQILIAQAQTEMPSTATSTLAGAATLPSGASANANLVAMTGGAGVESYSALLGVVATAQYDRIAPAANDAASLGAWRTHVVAEVGATIGHLETVTFAIGGSLSDARTLTQSSLNEPLMQCLWLQNTETPPSELAASHTALRSVVESANPSPRYMNTEVKGAAPQALREDWPIESVRDAALNAGVTPLMTTEDGKVVVNRGITTYSKFGSAADDRVLDVNQAVMPLFQRERIAYVWNTDIAPNYEHVRDNPGPNDPETPAGIITPDQWNATVYGELKRFELNGWVTNVDDYPPFTMYDKTSKRLMGEYPCVPAQGNYQLGFNVPQIGNP